MLKSCPDPIDVQDLQFKLHCKLKVFNNKELHTFPKAYNLISCASRYGLLFLGSNTSNLQVIQLNCLENYSPKDKEISNYPRRNIPLPSPPLHVCVNCDSTILAVVTERDNCATVTFYDVLSFLKQNVIIIKEVRLSSTPGIYVKEIGWNPALPPIFTACKSDGTLGIYEIKGTSININELPTASEATCFCWSPKGKQLAVGSKNSRITQYKPDLKAVKVINQPPLEGAYSLISLQWVSNYQFIGIYQSAEPEGTAKLIVVDAPKTGDPVYVNYEDVCYSGTARLPQFYMILQQHWNILMVASSNSTELGVLGSSGETWTQWIISDSARAELPLSLDHQETLPLGMALDISSTRPLPWNESTIPPCPYLLILSHHGVLCLFSVVNLKAGVPSICTPPDPISDLSGVQQFVVPLGNAAAMQPPEPPKITVPSFSIAQIPPTNQAPVFGVKVLAQPQHTYAMPGTLIGGKSAETMPLFGGQVTITPIKPQQTATQPLSGSQPFITPISKQQANPAGTVTPAEKYSAIFSSLNTAATAAPPPIEIKPILVTPAQNLPKPPAPVELQTPVQAKIGMTAVKPAETPKAAVNLKIKEETEILLAQMLRDECISLESELKALLHQGRLVNVDIGTENEKVELVTKIKSLQEFIKEIVDISIGENAEVHYLKQNLIQSWAWFEEARSRYTASKDETVSLLLRSQPLDSATEKRQADIRKIMYYIGSQITQASKALDEQWDNFQDYAKKVHRSKMPTMEAIFQAMVRQNGILQKQTYILKDIASLLKGKGRGANVPSLLLSVENTTDLEDSLNRLIIEHPKDIHQVQYERVLNRMKSLSEIKTKKLRNLLRTREVQHITATKPQLSSSLMLQSPESKTKRLLSSLAALGTPASPLSETLPVPRALSFVHSTPIRVTKSDIKPTETPPNTPQVDSKAFTFKRIDKSSLTTILPTSNSFIPLSKSASVFSHLPQEGVSQTPLTTHSPSAFVPTQVNFGSSGKLFNFSSIATTTTGATAKTTPTSIVATTTVTFSFSAASSTLPKFGTSTMPNTTDSSNSMKTSLPKLNFGDRSVSSVTTNKTEIATADTTTKTLFGTTTTTKPKFSFGATSNIFGAKVTVATTSQSSMPITSASTLFSNMSQGSKPLIGTTASSSSNFGAVPSAFTAVTTSTSNLSLLPTAAVNLTTKTENSTAAKPSIFANTSTPDGGLGKSTTTATNVVDKNMSVAGTAAPVLAFGNVTTTKGAVIFGTAAVAAVSASPAVVTTVSVLGSITATTKPSIFQTGSSTSASAEVTSTSTPIFAAPTSIKQSLAIGSPSTTTTVSIISSGAPAITATTARSTKPSPSTTGVATSAQSLFFGVPQSITSSTTSTAPTTSVSVSTTTSQPSIFATPSSSSLQLILEGAVNSQQVGGLPQSQITTGPAVTSPSASNFDSGGVTASSQTSIFGTRVMSTQPSIFGGTQSTTSGDTTTTLQTSIFDSAKATPPSQPSIFGSTAVTPTQLPMFGGTQSNTSGINTTTQATSIFGANSTVSSTQSSIFDTTSSTKSSMFNTSTVPKTTATSIFGGASTTTTQSPMFVVSSTSATTKPSVFNAPAASSSLFGTNTATSSQQGLIFASGASTSPGSIFGSTTTGSISGQTSLFGAAQSASTTKASIFGGSQTSTTQNSIFAASTAPSTQNSIFGTPNTTAATPFASGFGSSTSPLAAPFGQTSSVFGASTTTASNFGGGFGTASGFTATASATTPSVFGQQAAFGSTSAPVFGTPKTAENIFGSTSSAFGTNTVTNVFGPAAISSPSSFSFATAASNTSNSGAFGFGGLNVGSSTTASSVFGDGSGTAFGQTTVANPFSRPAEQKSPFGSTGASVFGSPASSSGSIFGSNTGSTFSSNTQGGFGSSTFGSPSTFGQQSTFGQSSFGTSSFGGVQPGPFSGGSGAVAQSGFGSPTSFSKPSGFGSSPVFGGSPQPAFGAAPSFGGAPAFGAAPAFGSPNKIFGASTPTAGFGSTTTGSPGFGNLANQNTVGFGNLAQQSSSPNSAQFSGSSSFSSWR